MNRNSSIYRYHTVGGGSWRELCHEIGGLTPEHGGCNVTCFGSPKLRLWHTYMLRFRSENALPEGYLVRDLVTLVPHVTYSMVCLLFSVGKIFKRSAIYYNADRPGGCFKTLTKYLSSQSPTCAISEKKLHSIFDNSVSKADYVQQRTKLQIKVTSHQYTYIL